jgi:hypothetical protein
MSRLQLAIEQIVWLSYLRSESGRLCQFAMCHRGDDLSLVRKRLLCAKGYRAAASVSAVCDPVLDDTPHCVTACLVILIFSCIAEKRRL